LGEYSQLNKLYFNSPKNNNYILVENEPTREISVYFAGEIVL